MRIHLFLPLLAGLAIGPACSGNVASGSGPVPLDQLVDEAALTDGIRSGISGYDAGDTVLVAIHYSEQGRLEEVRVSDHPAALRLTEVVRGAARAEGPRNSGGMFLLAGGDPPSLTPYRPSGDRAPRLINRDELVRQMERIGRGFIGRRALINLYVGADGEVKDWTLAQSSGSQEADLALMEIARAARFAPPMIDDYAMPAWAQMPFTIADPAMLPPDFEPQP